MTFCFLKATAFGNFSFLEATAWRAKLGGLSWHADVILSLVSARTSREHARTVCRKQLSLGCATKNVGKLKYFEMPAYSFPTSMALIWIAIVYLPSQALRFFIKAFWFLSTLWLCVSLRCSLDMEYSFWGFWVHLSSRKGFIPCQALPHSVNI